MKSKELEGMTLGIWAMVFAFIIPLVTYICGGIGLSKANKQIRNDKATPTSAKTLNKTAMIVTTVLLVIAVIGGIAQ